MTQDALERLLAEHPWPARKLERGAPVERVFTFELDASVDELWPYLSDTSRFNRAMGLSRMEFTEVDGQLRGRTRRAGITEEWVEVPWTWVARRTLTSIRDYSRGLSLYSQSHYVIEELPDNKTRLRISFGVIPKGFAARLLVKAALPSFQQSYDRLLSAIVRQIKETKGDGTPLSAPVPPLSPEVQARLASLAGELAAAVKDRASPDLVLRLTRHIEMSDEMDLSKIQVRPLARKWGVDPRDLLFVCLHATRVGLLKLSWDVICPHCRGSRLEVDTLGDLPPSGDCSVCDVEFENDREESIEVTFHVHPSIRDIPKLFYCSAEPATKKHIEVQLRLAPGERRRVETALAPGVYRRRIQGSKAYLPLEIDERSRPGAIEWTASAAEGADDEPRPSRELSRGTAIGPRPTLELENATDKPQTFIVEDVAWADDALRPGHLFGLQEFRDLFARESLAAEVNLAIGDQTILFTDMVGSTRFYETQGDPSAFKEVRRHFTELYDEVKKYRGAVVKTIGDAVMAAFADPVDALRAASGIQARFPISRRDTPVRLRITLNQGPCIAVNLNSAIDYFGRTVNIAAKLQSLAETGHIVFPRSVVSSPGVMSFLEEQGATLEELTMEHAAFTAPLLAYRWDTERSRATRPSGLPPLGS